MIHRRRLSGEWFDHHPYIRRRAAALQEYIERFDLTNPSYHIYTLADKMPEFIPGLRRSFGNKCVFCEARLDDAPDNALRHLFRPARLATQLDQDGDYPNHYFWLQLDWRNIYLICGDCAKCKGFMFPVQAERAAVGASGDELRLEKPLLLDPCDHLKNPLIEFAFAEDGTVAVNPSSRNRPMAEATIHVFGLNRAALCQARAAETVQFRALFEAAQTDALTHQDAGGLVDGLAAACDDLVAFAGMKRQLLYQWIDPRLRRRKRWKSLVEQLQQWNEFPLVIQTPKKPGPHAKASFSHGYAVLIGVGRYQSPILPPLRSPDTDAQALFKILKDPQQCAYSRQNMRLLTNEQATRVQILEELGWLAKASHSNPNMTTLFFFSGHGMLADQRFFLLPNNADLTDLAQSAISGEELFTAIRAIRSQRRLIVLDCCHAGAVSSAAVAKDVAAPKAALSSIPPQFVQDLDQGEGMAIISSSTATQQSFILGQYMKLSLFTSVLLEALRGKATPPDQDVISVFDVMDYVRREVPSRAREFSVEQEPHIHFNGLGFDIALKPRSM
jgi:Caspase domain